MQTDSMYLGKKMSSIQPERNQLNTHQCVFINQPSISQALRCEVINWIHGNATASEGEPAKGATHCINNSVLWCDLWWKNIVQQHAARNARSLHVLSVQVSKSRWSDSNWLIHCHLMKVLRLCLFCSGFLNVFCLKRHFIFWIKGLKQKDLIYTFPEG